MKEVKRQVDKDEADTRERLRRRTEIRSKGSPAELILPQELWQKIISFLPYSSRFSLRRVCHAFHRAFWAHEGEFGIGDEEVLDWFLDHFTRFKLESTIRSLTIHANVPIRPLLRGFSHVRALTFEAPSADQIHVIPLFPYLRSLEIFGLRCPANFSGLTRLRNLVLTLGKEMRFTSSLMGAETLVSLRSLTIKSLLTLNRSASNLCNLQYLTHLTLKSGKFAQARHPEVTFSFLSSLTRLQSLHLAGFELSGIDPFLAPLTNLTRVHLRGYDRNFVPVPALSALTGLRHLKLALPFIFPCVLGLEAITALTGLRYLSLAQSVTEGDDVSYLSALKALEVLEIEYFSDPFSQIPALCECRFPQLHSLTYREEIQLPLQLALFSGLSLLTALTSLYLPGWAMDNSNLSWVKHLSMVGQLKLYPGQSTEPFTVEELLEEAEMERESRKTKRKLQEIIDEYVEEQEEESEDEEADEESVSAEG